MSNSNKPSLLLKWQLFLNKLVNTSAFTIIWYSAYNQMPWFVGELEVLIILEDAKKEVTLFENQTQVSLKLAEDLSDFFFHI